MVGLRRVGLYHYEFKTHAKGRWVGRTVLDVFAKEFSAHSLAYYVPVALVHSVCVMCRVLCRVTFVAYEAQHT
jgi:5,10-methenyltetrahydromethanopterin hydrogenase